ncbi:CopG family ribbon-helix-helix protein [Thermodesulfitimonas sp.]
MRRTKVWALSLPPALAEKAEELARKEHRSRSELVREALRQYIASREWETLQLVAARRARELGISSEDAVEELIDDLRQ